MNQFVVSYSFFIVFIFAGDLPPSSYATPDADNGAPEFNCEYRNQGKGLEVANYEIEPLCAMECYQKQNCSKYLYNKPEKKCILMTSYDWNFMAEEWLESLTDFKLKVGTTERWLS